MQLTAPLGFTRNEDVFPDEDRPGLLRARTLPFGDNPEEAFDFRSCALNDGCDVAAVEAGFEEAGFETVDLSSHRALQQALATVRSEDRISSSAASALRESLAGARLRLTSGKSVHIEHVAEDGVIHRRAGPNGLDLNPGELDGGNGHDAAKTIHGDQDVFGTPLKQMMNGAAPDMFRHVTPDARNLDSALCLLNLWIPIQQITRPLVLMDRRTLDAKRHQLLYGLPVTRFLDRDEDSKTNDIWTFLPDPNQAWYFRSEMGPEQGYVFDTLGEPHGSCILPGEEALEAFYLALGRASEAAEAGDAETLGAIVGAEGPELPALTTDPIREAFGRMRALLHEAGSRAAEICSSGDDWSTRARAAMDKVVRRSIEMRLVATLTSD
jgi:hypothetical protein